MMPPLLGPGLLLLLLSIPSANASFLMSRGLEPDFQRLGDLILGGVFAVCSRPHNFLPQGVLDAQPKPESDLLPPLEAMIISVKMTLRSLSLSVNWPPELQDYITNCLWDISKFSSSHYRMVQSFVFTIEEINKNPELLPNFTLGFSIWDSGSSELGALWGMMALVTGQGRPIPNYACAPPEAPLAAILGEDRSALSIPMATWLGLYRTPQVSYGSTVSVLSDKRRFPSFLRTLPPDEARARGMALLAARLACYEVGLVAQEDEYGQRGERALRPELEAAGLCVYVTAELPSAPRVDKLQEAIRTLTVAQPRVLLVFSGAHEFLLLAAELHKEPASRLWICSEVWDPAAVPVMLPELAGRQALHGALAFSGHRGCIPGFADFLGRLHPSRASEDQFLVPFWEETFGCRWLHNSSSSSSAGRGRAPGGLLRGQEGSGGGQEEREEGRRGGRGAEADSCTGEERLGGQALPFLDMSDLSVTYAVANAVSSVAHALHDMAACEAGDGPFGDGRCADMPHFQPWQVKGLQ